MAQIKVGQTVVALSKKARDLDYTTYDVGAVFGVVEAFREGGLGLEAVIRPFDSDLAPQTSYLVEDLLPVDLAGVTNARQAGTCPLSRKRIRPGDRIVRVEGSWTLAVTCLGVYVGSPSTGYAFHPSTVRAGGYVHLWEQARGE